MTGTSAAVDPVEAYPNLIMVVLKTAISVHGVEIERLPIDAAGAHRLIISFPDWKTKYRVTVEPVTEAKP